MSGCGPGNGDVNTNDQYLSFYNSSGALLAFNDDYCGSASYISYTIDPNQGCQYYTLIEACYDMSACFGQIAVTGAEGAIPVVTSS